MFRKIFAAFVAALTVVVSVAVNAAEYKVKKGDCLWGIARKAGQPGLAYKEIVALNASRFNGRSVGKIFPGEELVVPDEWGVALGMELFIPEFAKPAPVEPPSNPFVVKTAVWPDILLLVLLVFFLAFFLDRALKNDPSMRRLEDAARRAGETAERGLRELTNCFFPTALQPCYAGGVGAWDVSQAMGWDQNQLQLEPVFGEYDVNCRLADGSVRSERRVFNGELGYSPRGTDGKTVVLKGCGNLARQRVGARRMTVGERLVRAAERTFRPEPLHPAVEVERKPVVMAPPAPVPAPSPERLVGPPNRQRVQFVKSGRWQARWVYRP